jgi:hypothetical protein
MFQRSSDLRTSDIMILQNGNIDQFEILPVVTSSPDAFSQFYPIPSRRGETRVGDIFVSSIAVPSVVVGSNKGVSNGIQQVIGYSGVIENVIDEKDKAVVFIVRIGVDVIIRIMPAIGVTLEASSSLAVFNKDDLSYETFRMIEDSLDETSDEVTVCATPILPLSIDFY